MTNSVETKRPDVLVYLDHNVLDLMRAKKGDPHKVKQLLNKGGYTPIFSEETLEEIYRSKGGEQDFLDVLEDINAKYIIPILDDNFKCTGEATIHDVSPKLQYEDFLNNKAETPDSDFGFSELLLKMFGGKQDISFEDIFNEGADQLDKYLCDSFSDTEGLPDEAIREIEKMRLLVPELKRAMKEQRADMVKQLDESDKSQVSLFEDATGVGPLTLKNIKPPNVVQKVWDEVSKHPKFPELDLDTFFGVKAHSFEADADRERTIQEKVNAIYHQLNFLGYYRDSKMKKEKRFIASFSDMTHAGVAAFCHVFLCRDKDLVMKAAAAYEYLGVGTKIVHYGNQKN